MRSQWSFHTGLALFALSLLAAGVPAGAVEPQRVGLPGFSCQSGKYGASLPATLPALRKLGRLQAEDPGEVQQWDDYHTTESVLRFDGLTVMVVTFSNDPDRYHLALLEVSSPRWRVSAPLRIGQPAGKILRELGVPSAPLSGEWRFAGESDALVLAVRDGLLSRITYDCYTG